MRKLVLAVLAAALVLAGCEDRETQVDVIEPGVWSWFQDPRAVHADDITYVGWTQDLGVFVGALDHDTGEWTTSEIGTHDEADDHRAPAFIVRADGRVLAAWSDTDRRLLSRVTTNPGDITSWDDPVTVDDPMYAYPNLLQVGSTHYLFARRMHTDGSRTHFMWTSTDGGDTWSQPTQITTTSGRPYAKFATDGARIDIAFSSDHPELTDDNSIHHVYYDGAWRTSDGTDLGEPPFSVDDFTTVYDGTDPADNAWIWDVAPGGAMVFATFPSETDHRYQHASWNGSTWDVTEIADAGGSIDEPGEPDDPFYSGGIILDHNDPANAYLSRQSGDGWTVQHWRASDGEWSMREDLTPAPDVKNIRPVVPRDGGPISVLWLAGSYESFLVFDTSIAAAAKLPAGDALRFDHTARGIGDGRFATGLDDPQQVMILDDTTQGRFDAAEFGF